MSTCPIFCNCKLSCNESISSSLLKVILEAAPTNELSALVVSLLPGFCSIDYVRRIREDISVRFEIWLLSVFINFCVVKNFDFYVDVSQFSVSMLKLAPSCSEKSKLRMPMFLVFYAGMVKFTELI